MTRVNILFNQKTVLTLMLAQSYLAQHEQKPIKIFVFELDSYKKS